MGALHRRLIGDWWAFGDHRYGERAAVAAAGLFPLSFSTVANAAVVCRMLETSRRREHLGWSHHVEVAPIARLNPDLADEILDRAEREGMIRRIAIACF